MENKIIDLSSLGKTKVTIVDGDEKKDLYLNLSDMNIVSRLQEKYDELNDLSTKYADIDVKGDDTESVLKLGATVKEVDSKVKEIIDYIFDAPVSEVCMSFGSCFDIINGKCRYEQVMDALMNLYSENITKETEKIQHVQKHAGKYLKA